MAKAMWEAFLDDARHGKGQRCSDAGGDEYDGEWVKGELIGKLYRRFARARCRSSWKRPTAECSHQYANGDLYRGGWEDGMPEGAGSMSYRQRRQLCRQMAGRPVSRHRSKEDCGRRHFRRFLEARQKCMVGVLLNAHDGDTYEGNGLTTYMMAKAFLPQQTAKFMKAGGTKANLNNDDPVSTRHLSAGK